jgi:ribonuclease H2 subunit C
VIDGNLEAYFRGRKLKGKSLQVPEGYKGIVVIRDAAKENDGAENARGQHRQDEGDDGKDEEEAKELHGLGSFDEVVLWGHESMVDEDDAFSKGMGEWIEFAEVVSPLQGLGTGCTALLTR